MIISASRRTDLPAFYPEETVRKILDMNGDSGAVQCVVFWTKNARPIMPHLPVLKAAGIPFYFQHTMTPYGKDLEPNVQNKLGIIENMIELAKRYGPNSVVWRYDPILLTEKYDFKYHLGRFERLSIEFRRWIDTCVISFIDIYGKIREPMSQLGIQQVSLSNMDAIAEELIKISMRYGIKLEACAETSTVIRHNIKATSCIDPERIARIIGSYPVIPQRKDPTQRKQCLCAPSTDIGDYGTCEHGCVYCYAQPTTKKIHTIQ